ncbi:CAP domain-containing protein [Modestobacter sp. SYSU DS0657]
MKVARPLLIALAVLVGASGCVAVDTRPGATGSAPSPESAPADDTSAPAEQRMAREIFDRVNAERAERGLEPVTWNDALADVARNWSEEMADNDTLEHQDIREVLQREELSGFVSIGENIFQSTGPVPAGTIHTGWMRSDDHRVNVLNPGWDRLGVGVFCAPDGGVWATQEFGRTTGADRPAVASTTPPAEPIARPEDDGPSCG